MGGKKVFLHLLFELTIKIIKDQAFLHNCLKALTIRKT